VGGARAVIVVSGMVCGDLGQGGAAWAVLQYLLGLRRLGHEVWFVEPVDRGSLTPAGSSVSGSANAAYFRTVMQQFELWPNCALLRTGSRETVGAGYDELFDACRRADLLLDISGLLTDERLAEPIRRRAYLDLDPAFNQLWHEAEGIDMRFDGHTHFVTVGLAIGQPECPVPQCERSWITTVPPVVLEHWPVSEAIEHDALTTVGNWRGYGSIDVDGVKYGQKAHSLRPLIGLPALTDEPFVLALGIHPDERRDLAALRENGWTLVDPLRVARTPALYRRFVGGSKAEFGIAKSGYVLSRCGWFSDRSACYLSSGKPVIAQETGFSDFVPAGEGLLSFTTQDEALAAIDDVRADYPRHARAARAFAEQHLDSDRVLSALLEALA
jgi:hypothetical protein